MKCAHASPFDVGTKGSHNGTKVTKRHWRPYVLPKMVIRQERSATCRSFLPCVPRDGVHRIRWGSSKSLLIGPFLDANKLWYMSYLGQGMKLVEINGIFLSFACGTDHGWKGMWMTMEDSVYDPVDLLWLFHWKKQTSAWHDTSPSVKEVPLKFKWFNNRWNDTFYNISDSTSTPASSGEFQQQPNGQKVHRISGEWCNMVASSIYTTHLHILDLGRSPIFGREVHVFSANNT